jgi:hypothetical protein
MAKWHLWRVICGLQIEQASLKRQENKRKIVDVRRKMDEMQVGPA